jgi:hypothetical protein
MEVGKNLVDSVPEGLRPRSQMNTKEEWAALQKVKAWLDDDKQSKQDFLDEMKEMHKAYMGDHWSLKGPTGVQIRSAETQANKPNSVDNIIFSQIEGFVAEFSIDPEIVCEPTERDDDDNSNALSELNQFLLNKNKFDDEQARLLRYGFMYGPFVAQDFWDPSWQGGRGPNRWIGDVRIKALHPDVLYIDARCKQDIQTARRVHKVVRYPLEHFKEGYPEKGQFVSEDTGNHFQTVGDDDEDTKSRNRTAWQIETWYKGYPLLGENKGYGLHVMWWSGDGDVMLKHQSYIYPEPKYPFIFRNLYEREGSIWGFGEIKQILSPQIILNKEDEMILEGNMQQAFGQTFYNQNGTINDKQLNGLIAKGTLPGMWFPVQDVSGIKRMYGTGIPASVMKHRESKMQAVETITGRFDTTQGKTPVGVTAASAIIELNNRATNRLKAKEKVLRAVYKEIGEKNNEFISWYYAEKRGYRILGTDGKYQHKEISNKQLKKVHIFEDSKVLPLQDFQPTDGMVENQHYEVYAPEYDVTCKIGNELPIGRAYYMELAKELFKGGIIDNRAVLYVLENGKLEPMDEILQRMEQQAQPVQPQGPQLPQGKLLPLGAKLSMSISDEAFIHDMLMNTQQAGQEQLQQLISGLPPGLQQTVMQLPPDKQQIFLAQLLQPQPNGGGDLSAQNDPTNGNGSTE